MPRWAYIAIAVAIALAGYLFYRYRKSQAYAPNIARGETAFKLAPEKQAGSPQTTLRDNPTKG